MKKIELCESEINIPSLRRASFQSDVRSNEDRHLAICLTLYNEPSNLLKSSLDSVIHSLDTLNRKNAHYRRATISIIADGESEVSHSTRAYLKTLGLQPCAHSLTDFDGSVRATLLSPSHPSASLTRRSPSGMEIRLQVVTKAQNAGKLDSHWWFYQEICPPLRPDYCFQIDAGTVLSPNAFFEICDEFDGNPETAGIASNVMISAPNDGNLLECFQCGDFAVQKTIRWPSEVFSGFLSVIPGQFSGLRWRAFSEQNSNNDPSPKDRYLRGQTCDSATERMMYLSEDRILGFELATEPDKINRLNFAPKADCHTDTCNTLSELLQQRRRWLNGSLFCRSWMIHKILSIFSDQTQPRLNRTRFAPALLNLCVQHMLEWFLPLLNILLLAVTWNSLGTLVSPISATAIFAALAGIWVLPTALALSGKIERLSPQHVQILLQLVKTVFFTIIAINLVSLAQKSDSFAYLYYLSMPFALTAGAFIGAFISNRTLVKHLRSSILTFISLAPSMWLMMSSYAFFNLHDGSWGTKGLCQKDACAAGTEQDIARQFKRLRLTIVSAWLASNLILAVVLVQTAGMSIALTVAASLQILMIATGMMGVVSAKMKRSGEPLSKIQSAAHITWRRILKSFVRRPRYFPAGNDAHKLP